MIRAPKDKNDQKKSSPRSCLARAALCGRNEGMACPGRPARLPVTRFYSYLKALTGRDRAARTACALTVPHAIASATSAAPMK